VRPLRLFPGSLRARLAFAFLALASLVLFVGGASLAINRRVHSRVVELRSSNVIDLRRVDLTTVGLEFEGFWNPAGSFVATDVEVLPPTDRPRLRGEIQGADPERRTITVFGRRILVPESCEWGDAPEEPVPIEELRPGHRVEVTCKVGAHGWEADKLYLRKVKSSDKVKGTVTASDLDGIAPDSVEIQGLVVALEPVTSEGPESALGHMEQATQMILALQQCLALSTTLGGGVARPGPQADPSDDEDGDESSESEDARAPEERLREAVEYFVGLVDQALGGGDEPLAIASQDYLRFLRPMARESQRLRVAGEELIRPGPTGRPTALAERQAAFESLVQLTLVPLAYAYLSQAEEDLGDETRAVLEATAATTKVALWTSGVAVVVALVLGFLVWRSIHLPIRELHDAAVLLGQGHLDTRTRVDSRDELGVLGNAFNKMASELATTTVSMESLESVFDSMAAALIVFDPEGNIVNVNRATTMLVGRPREELVGQSFDVMCRFSAGESVRPGPSARDPSGLPAMRIETVEKVFVRKDGSEFPVSLSGAELRSGGGPLQGYVCVALDLTEQKRIQARLRESLSEKEMLLREVHHRVKNNMQVISSLLAMQSTEGDPEVEKKLEESQNRIRSIALIHEQLYRSSELANIDVRTYLDVLTNQLLQSFGKSGDVHLELAVDPIELDIDQSMACGLIVNELITNALKYAYPNGKGGTIRLSLVEHENGERVLTVADDGPGLPAERTRGKPTLGMSLIATLARQLRGRVETDGSKGTVVRVFFARKQPEIPVA